MAQEVTNFARFYTLFNKLPCTGDREEFKKSIVLQYTWNRTDSLKEMTAPSNFVGCSYKSKFHKSTNPSAFFFYCSTSLFNMHEKYSGSL